MLAILLLSGNSAATAYHTAEARLVFVGDLMVGRYVGASMQAHGYDAPFDSVRQFVSGADLAVGNLEGPVVPSAGSSIPAPSPNQPSLAGDERAAKALARAGFDLLSVANNHSMDAGVAGFGSTVSALRNAGMEPLGLDTAGVQQPIVRNVRGLKIAFLAYTTIPPNRPADAGAPGPTSQPAYIDPVAPSSEQRISLEVGRAKQAAALVVVMFHWGTEYATRPDDTQRRLARAASRAGAGLVVGAHPHVVQGMELIRASDRSTLVAYSLGNALFDQAERKDTRQGTALECTVDTEGVKSARLIPLEIGQGKNGYVMLQADNASGQANLQRAALSTPDSLRWHSIWDSSQKEPGLAIAYVRQGRHPPPEGDSVPAEADLGPRVRSAYRAGQRHPLGERARPPGWLARHLEIRAGLAGHRLHRGRCRRRWPARVGLHSMEASPGMEQPQSGGMTVDQNGGAVLPHIYIDGCGRGAINPVWHGSPRPAPSLAVAVAPIGPSGKPLLAVLESADRQQEKAPGTIRLWEWTGGFGYELAAALPGTYSEMWSDGKVLVFR